MENSNFGPNVIYFVVGHSSRQVIKIYEFNVPMSVLGLGERQKTYDLYCPRAKCQKKLWASDKKTWWAMQKKKHGRGRPIVLFLTSR